jgi:hypothetical protein
MAKGLFTQGMCVLLRKPVSVDEVLERLSGFTLSARHDAIDDVDSEETLVFEFQAEAGGHLLVTPSTGKWPDDLGDPDESPERFVAWSLGQFGPLAFPGCLKRAVDQSWGWEAGSELAPQHTAHIRLLISYVLGAEESEDDDDDDELPLVPEDYDPIDELEFITKAVAALLELPDAICYFNPGGEVLRDDGGLRRGLNHAWNLDMPPLDMWTNVRLFRTGEQWTLMDTVGNGQFDLPDLEAVFPTDKYEPSDVESFLRSASLYMVGAEEEVEEGDTADGPGECSWLAMECHDALSDPPRETVRWFPQDGSMPPEELLDRGEEAVADEDFLVEDDDVIDDDLDSDIDF